VGGKKIAALIIRGLQYRPHTTSTDRQLATAVVTVDFFFFFSASQSSKSQNNFESPKSNGDDDNKSMPCKEKIARDAKSLTHLSLNTLADALDVVRLISSTL
jgi:hypothetical protein